MYNNICLAIARFFLRRMSFRAYGNKELFNRRYDEISRMRDCI
jgi:hypothetical protein